MKKYFLFLFLASSCVFAVSKLTADTKAEIKAQAKEERRQRRHERRRLRALQNPYYYGGYPNLCFGPPFAWGYSYYGNYYPYYGPYNNWGPNFGLNFNFYR